MDKQRTEISITWATLWRILFMLVLVVALYLVKGVLVVLFLAIIISSALDGPVSFLEKRKIPRILGTIVLFLVILSALALILYTIIPIAIIEFQEFIKNISRFQLPVFGPIDAANWLENLDKNLGEMADKLFSGGISFLNFIVKAFGNIILVITTLVLSFYLTVSRGGVEKFLRAILPITYESYIIDVYLRVRKKLGYWLQGQIVLMIVVGFIVFLSLWFLGVKYSLALGILAGVLEIVPIAGPIFAGTLAVLVAVSDSWLLALYVFILFIAVQQLENHLLVPVVMRRAVGISPVIVVVALLAGSEIAGVLGVILAVPVAVVFQEIIGDWEKQKMRTKSNRLEI